MTDTPWSVTGKFRVGKRTCTLTIQSPQTGKVTQITAEWEPGVPNRLSKQEMRQYRAGRDAIAAALAKKMGGGVMVVET